MSAQIDNIEKRTRLGEHDYDRAGYTLLSFHPYEQRSAREDEYNKPHQQTQLTNAPMHQCQHFKLLCGVEKKHKKHGFDCVWATTACTVHTIPPVVAYTSVSLLCRGLEDSMQGAQRIFFYLFVVPTDERNKLKLSDRCKRDHVGKHGLGMVGKLDQVSLL